MVVLFSFYDENIRSIKNGSLDLSLMVQAAAFSLKKTELRLHTLAEKVPPKFCSTQVSFSVST
ncbi:hypothetical protein J2Z65_000060 [Paenibacillus aceris]|uniref:Uncharacterized protein n=1 Tax=Paenibacillus aceris TaxID=869555 RepID=A0ABS4HR31_9BACL|nr:hypothetical protein [Paenibacillus aceris]